MTASEKGSPNAMEMDTRRQMPELRQEVALSTTETAVMADLTVFLHARLDEDEAAAMAATGTAWAWEATGDKDSSWAVGHVEGEDGRPLSGEIDHGQGVVIDGVCESINGNLADAAHVARHDPARALREVEAKRRILAEHSGNHKCGWWIPGCPTVEALAAIYNVHPDYRPEREP